MKLRVAKKVTKRFMRGWFNDGGQVWYAIDRGWDSFDRARKRTRKWANCPKKRRWLQQVFDLKAMRPE